MKTRSKGMTKKEAIEMVSNDGWCFKNMKKFHTDRDVVIAAVSKNGYNLDHASYDLQCDFEVVLRAVYQNGRALEYAQEELKTNKEIILTALINRPDMEKYIRDTIPIENIISSLWSISETEKDLENITKIQFFEQ